MSAESIDTAAASDAPAAEAPPKAAAPSPRARVLFAVKLAITALLVYGIAGRILAQPEAEGLGETLAQLRWEWIALGLLVHLVGVAANVTRWRTLLAGQGLHAPARFAIGSLLIARFVGALSPGGFTGFGGWRIYDVGTHTGKWARATATIAVETLVGWLGFGSMVMLGSIFGADIIGTSGVVLVNVAFGSLMLAGIALIVRPAIFRAIAHLLPLKIRLRVQTLIDALQGYRGNARGLLIATLCAVTVHATHFLIYVCTARALGVTEIGVGTVFFGSALQILATMVPASINGIGLREMTAVALYTSLGVPLTSAVLIATLGFALEMSVSLTGAPFFLARRTGYQANIRVDDADREKAAHAAIPEALAAEWPLVSRGALVGLSAGMVAGLLVGVLEGLVVVYQGHGRTGPWVVAYGAMAYGIFFGLGGAAMLAASAQLGRWMKREAVREATAYGHTIAFFASAAAFGLGVFRVRRDVFEEQLRWASLNGVLVLLGAVAASALLYFLLSRVSSALAARLPKASAGSSIAVAAICALLVPTALFIGEPGRAAASGAVGTPPSGASPVLVIVVDTLRADHLPAYGYEGGSTPHLDAFAADAIRFDQAFSNASWTRPSFASILTGRYPSSHSVMAKSDALPSDLTTMAEAFREGGYHTAGVVTNYNVAPYFAFDQGFDAYDYLEPDFILGADDSAAKLLLVQFLRQRLFEPARDRLLGVRPGVAYQDAETVNRTVLALLDGAPSDRPLFLFAAYMDPHDPYYAHPYDGTAYSRAAHPSPAPDEAEHLEALYDGEITYWDEHFGRLIEELQRRGLYDQMTIVVTADHGEEFGEHGGFFHGTTLYDEQVHVPLFVRLPGGRRAGTSVGHWVQSIDIMPTLLRGAGLPVPEGVQGGDLFEGSDRLFAEESHEGNVLEAVRERTGDGELKLITANAGNPRGLPERELFLVDRDPGETHDVSGSEPALLEHATHALEAAHLRAAEGAVEGAEVELDSASRRQLCELGYLTGEECEE